MHFRGKYILPQVKIALLVKEGKDIFGKVKNDCLHRENGYFLPDVEKELFRNEGKQILSAVKYELFHKMGQFLVQVKTLIPKKASKIWVS